VGITPILEAGQMRELLDSIETASLKGLRDRAAIAVMAYTFARVSAVVLLLREDYRLMGKRPQLRLQEKGGKEKLVWLHHEARNFWTGTSKKPASPIPDPRCSRRSTSSIA
jgi:integrase/recombinase XerD